MRNVQMHDDLLLHTQLLLAKYIMLFVTGRKQELSWSPSLQDVVTLLRPRHSNCGFRQQLSLQTHFITKATTVQRSKHCLMLRERCNRACQSKLCGSISSLDSWEFYSLTREILSESNECFPERYILPSSSFGTLELLKPRCGLRVSFRDKTGHSRPRKSLKETLRF